MNKRVTVEELATNLSALIAEVKCGKTIRVVEDGKEVATLSPIAASASRGVRYPFRNL